VSAGGAWGDFGGDHGGVGAVSDRKIRRGGIRSIGQTKEDAASGVIKTGTLGAVGVVGSVVAGLIVYKLLFGGRK